MGWLKNFLHSSTWAQTLANKAIRHGATGVGGAIFALAVNHGVAGSTATDLQNEAIGLVITLGGLALSYFDGVTVDKKITQAAAGGVEAGLDHAQQTTGMAVPTPPATIAAIAKSVAAGGQI